MDEYRVQVLPDEKANTVKSFQERGEGAAMVGDGINDAPRTGTGRHRHRARDRHGHRVDRRGPQWRREGRLAEREDLQENTSEPVLGPLVYSTASTPIAARVLYPFTDTLLSTAIAAAAMAFSSASVLTNASLPRRYEP